MWSVNPAFAVRNRYDELSRVFTAANSGGSNEMIETINDQYDKLMAVLNESKSVEAVKEKATVSDKIKELQGKIAPEGLHFEVCGTWLWVTGKTYQVKDTLKELGFRYSANKLSLYYRQDDHRSGNQEPIPLEMIREKYGTSVVALR
jgi:chromosome condensin MukBEF MukE localization factor